MLIASRSVPADAVDAAVEGQRPGAGVVEDDILVCHRQIRAGYRNGDIVVEGQIEVGGVDSSEAIDVGTVWQVVRRGAGIDRPAVGGAVPEVDVGVVGRTTYAGRVGVARRGEVEVFGRRQCACAELVGTAVETAQRRACLVVEVESRVRRGSLAAAGTTGAALAAAPRLQAGDPGQSPRW